MIPIAACICSLVPSQLRASEEVPPFLDAATAVHVQQQNSNADEAARGVWGFEVDGAVWPFQLEGEFPGQFRNFTNCGCIEFAGVNRLRDVVGIRTTHRIFSSTTVVLAFEYSRFDFPAKRLVAPLLVSGFDTTALKSLDDVGNLEAHVTVDELSLEPSVRFDLLGNTVFAETGGSIGWIVRQRGSTEISGIPPGSKDFYGDTLSSWQTTRIGTPRMQAFLFAGLGATVDIVNAWAIVADIRFWSGLTPLFQEVTAKISWDLEPRVGLRFEL